VLFDVCSVLITKKNSSCSSQIRMPFRQMKGKRSRDFVCLLLFTNYAIVSERAHCSLYREICGNDGGGDDNGTDNKWSK